MAERRSSVDSEFQLKTKKLVGCKKLWGDFQSELKQSDSKTGMGARNVLEKFIAEKMPHDDKRCSKEGEDLLSKKKLVAGILFQVVHQVGLH